MDGVCTLYLCENTILSVVLLQDVLERQLDLLLEFLHLHLLLQPGPVCEINHYKRKRLFKCQLGSCEMLQWHRGKILIDREKQEGNSAPCRGECVSASFFPFAL